MHTVEYYKSIAKGQPHYHGGLGCIKLPLRNGMRAHFWSDATPSMNESGRVQIHDHRLDFSSIIKKGSAKNIIYNVEGVDEVTGLHLGQSDCVDGQLEIIEQHVTLTEMCSFVSNVDDTYWLHHRTFHDFIPENKTVTWVKQDEIVQMSRFVMADGEHWVDAFSNPMTLEEGWEAIRHTLS